MNLFVQTENNHYCINMIQYVLL